MGTDGELGTSTVFPRRGRHAPFGPTAQAAVALGHDADPGRRGHRSAMPRRWQVRARDGLGEIGHGVRSIQSMNRACKISGMLAAVDDMKISNADGTQYPSDGVLGGHAASSDEVAASDDPIRFTPHGTRAEWAQTGYRGARLDVPTAPIFHSRIRYPSSSDFSPMMRPAPPTWRPLGRRLCLRSTLKTALASCAAASAPEHRDGGNRMERSTLR